MGATLSETKTRWHTSALIVEFITSQHFSMRPSNCSKAAAANTETTVFGSSVTSSRYSEPNTIFNANNKWRKEKILIIWLVFLTRRALNRCDRNSTLTIEWNFRINNFNGNKILFTLTPRSTEHTGKVWTLAQINLMQMPHFTQCHHRYIRVLLLHKECFVNVLRRCHQLFPVKQTQNAKLDRVFRDFNV